MIFTKLYGKLQQPYVPVDFKKYQDTEGHVVIVRTVEVVGTGIAAAVEGLDRGEIAAEG